MTKNVADAINQIDYNLEDPNNASLEALDKLSKEIIEVSVQG